jgi:hypothetical protein
VLWQTHTALMRTDAPSRTAHTRLGPARS